MPSKGGAWYNLCMEKSPKRPYSVSEISALVRNCLEERFGIVEVEGEITDFRGANGAGHFYFSLKDSQSRIAAVLFAGRAFAVRAKVENGRKVRVRGRLTAYGGTSRYQIIVESMADTGVGDLAAQFEELKRRLSAEGLFDDSRKRPLPVLPRHVGVVTSPTGSVIRDFVNVLTRRFPNIDILVAPARVQGAGAAGEIAAGVRLLNDVGTPAGGPLSRLPRRDVIVVMRGGGSMEELWCFNEEAVARAIAASAIPVVSGVGHQTDFTIADFVADLRAPTPSAAAELIVRPKSDFLHELESLSSDMESFLAARIEFARSRLAAARSNRVFSEPSHLTEHFMQRVDGLARSLETSLSNAVRDSRDRISSAEKSLAVRRASFLPEMRSRLDGAAVRMGHSVRARLSDRRAALAALSRQLSALSPLGVLERGYSITVLESGHALRDPSEVRPGDRLETRLARGGKVLSVVDGAPHPRRQPRQPAPAQDQLELW